VAKLSSDQQAAVNALLNKGDVAGATKLLGEINEKLEADAKNPPAPRQPANIVLDLFKGVHALLGHNPALDALLKELEDVVNPPKEAAPTK
jgi:hypothetical protein